MASDLKRSGVGALRILLALTLLVAVSCGGAKGEETPASGEAGRLQIASQALCDAVGLASEGDVEAAEAKFIDRVHGFLHEFADRLSATDREATAQLLEAKQRVEAAFADTGGAGGDVAAALSGLQAELAQAAEIADLPTERCEERL